LDSARTVNLLAWCTKQRVPVHELHAIMEGHEQAALALSDAGENYFTEILIVITYSGRTQAAIILGMIGFIAINLVGDYYLTNFELSETMSAFTEVIKEKLLR